MDAGFNFKTEKLKSLPLFGKAILAADCLVTVRRWTFWCHSCKDQNGLKILACYFFALFPLVIGKIKRGEHCSQSATKSIQENQAPIVNIFNNCLQNIVPNQDVNQSNHPTRYNLCSGYHLGPSGNNDHLQKTDEE